MRFDRKFFKEAFKAGYIKAKKKLLRENTDLYTGLEGYKYFVFLNADAKTTIYNLNDYNEPLIVANSLGDIFETMVQKGFGIRDISSGVGERKAAPVYEKQGNNFKYIGELVATGFRSLRPYIEVCKKYKKKPVYDRRGIEAAYAILTNGQEFIATKQKVEKEAAEGGKPLSQLAVKAIKMNPDHELVKDGNFIWFVTRNTSFKDKLKNIGRGITAWNDRHRYVDD